MFIESSGNTTTEKNKRPMSSWEKNQSVRHLLACFLTRNQWPGSMDRSESDTGLVIKWAGSEQHCPCKMCLSEAGRKMFIFLGNVFSGNVSNIFFFLIKRPSASNFSSLFFHYRERFLNHAKAVTCGIKCSSGISLQWTSQECQFTGRNDHKPANPKPPWKNVP